MTPLQINRAIAEACGWKQTSKGWWVNDNEGTDYQPEPPDYHSDLNAMHEAEGTLPVDERTTYFQRLYDVTYHPNDWSHGFAQITATAAQRAEAFLRVLGKWEDGK